jgi:hypothetical protein
MVESDGSFDGRNPPPPNNEDDDEEVDEGQEGEDAASAAGNSDGSEEVVALGNLGILPDEASGDLSKWIISTMPTTPEARARIVAEMKEYKDIMEEGNGG